MKSRGGAGFTFIEIIMTVVILGIIALLAVPKFINFRDDAQKAAEEATICAVQNGINIANAVEKTVR